jgi:hypothetical protein
MLAFSFLMMSWLWALGAVGLIGLAVYYAVAGKGIIWASLLFGAVFVALLGCVLARWLAKGLLEGRRGRAIVACILMLVYAVGTFASLRVSVDMGGASHATVVSVGFFNRKYWKTRRTWLTPSARRETVPGASGSLG